MKNFEFVNNGYDVKINRLDTAYPWVNYLTNTRLTAMISQAGGGFLWYKSPKKFRITRYRYNQTPTDTPGFYVYIKEKGGDVWCPTFNPIKDKDTTRYTVHRPGETVYYATHGDTVAVLSFFIPPNQDTLIWELTLENKGKTDKEYEVYGYAELSQFDWNSEQSFGYYWQHMLRTSYDAEHQTLFYTFNFAKDDYHKAHYPLVYFASDHPVKSFSGDRDAFVGNYNQYAK
jgi:cellobiose phosphorylase